MCYDKNLHLLSWMMAQMVPVDQQMRVAGDKEDHAAYGMEHREIMNGSEWPASESC